MSRQRPEAPLINDRTIEVRPNELGILLPGLDRNSWTNAMAAVLLTDRNFAVAVHAEDKPTSLLVCTGIPTLVEAAVSQSIPFFKRAGAQRLAVTALNLEPEGIDEEVRMERQAAVVQSVETLRQHDFTVGDYVDIGRGGIALVTAYQDAQVIPFSAAVSTPSRQQWFNMQRFTELLAEGVEAIPAPLPQTPDLSWAHRPTILAKSR